MNLKILKYSLYIILVITCAVIFFTTFVFIQFNGIVKNFVNGILINVFLTSYICAVILAIMFRKNLKTNWVMPLILTLCILFAAFFNAVTYNIIQNHVSTYNRQNWDNNENLRIYMIEDLEKQYQFIGKTETEVTDFLGHPANISYYSGKRLEYYIGNGYIDPYTYDIIIENNIVADTDIVQH